jgi:protein phosphatase
MGTTLVVAALLADVAGPRWLLASVGDSRIYRVAGGATEQMTDDHSVVQELLDSGEISLAEAAVHPDRHVITRAIGIGRDLLVDYQVHPVREGDRLVLCSDGVHGALSDAQFASLAAAFPGEPQTAATGLAEAVLASPASDNLTVVVVDACAVESAFELDQAAIQDTTPRPRTDAPADH